MPTVLQRHRRTDGRTSRRTTYDSNTALALHAHRAVKIGQRLQNCYHKKCVGVFFDSRCTVVRPSVSFSAHVFSYGIAHSIVNYPDSAGQPPALCALQIHLLTYLFTLSQDHEVHAIICQSLLFSSTVQPFIWFSCLSYLCAKDVELPASSHSEISNSWLI